MKKIFYSIIFLLIFCLNFSYAGQEIYTNKLTGNEISSIGTFITQDDKFPLMTTNPSWTNIFRNYSVTNKVTLKFDERLVDSSWGTFTFSVNLEIKAKDESNTSLATIYKTLSISYNPSSGTFTTDNNSFVFANAHYIDIKVLSHNGLANIYPAISLVSEIDIIRYYSFDYFNAPANLNDSIVGNCNVLLIRWDPIDGAEEYDLEITYINDYGNIISNYVSASNLSYDFRNNATRITTNKNSYELPLIYSHGYVLYRVRATGRLYPEYNQRIVGAWTNSNETGTVSSFADKYLISTPHQNDGKNWQRAIMYNENGKRTDGVSYFDGTMRNRQQVGFLNTFKSSIVAETFYDYQGRPAVYTLPTPTYNECIEYYSAFNLNTNETSYNKLNFDIDQQNVCEPGIEAFSTSSGAGNYYSSFNSNKDMQQAFVPDAEGYPFIRIEYTPDLTGRIRTRSAFGADLTIGTGKETKFFYVQPLDAELKKYFGPQVGAKNFYQKHVTIDPNGLLSISYINMSGQVIATSNVTDLNSSSATSTAISSPDEHVEGDNNGSLLFSKDIFLPKNALYEFSYSISPETFKDTCLPANICFDCIYDLEISIINDCGEEVLPGGVFKTTIGHLPLDTLCQDTNYVYTAPSDTLSLQLLAGKYTIKKKLSVNQASIEYYTEKYINNSTCIKSFNDFLNERLDSIDFSGCYTTYCDRKCVAELGTRQQYILNGGSGQDYDNLFAACVDTCNITDYCENLLSTLEADVSPGGQYGEYFNTTTMSVDSTFIVSVFNISNFFTFPPSYSEHWRNPFTPYKNHLGNNDTVNLNGNLYLPQNLPSLSAFINNWSLSWAASLVPYHPEYCYYTFCTENYSSHSYDSDMMRTRYFSDALANNLFNPLNQVINIVPSGHNNPDPFFESGNGGANYSNAIKNKLFQYFNVQGTNYSIWQVAFINAFCPEIGLDTAAYNNCLFNNNAFNNFWNNPDTCMADKVWQAFRWHYLSIKQYYYALSADDYATANNCNNSVIGSNYFTGKKRRFARPEEFDITPDFNNVASNTSTTLTNAINDMCEDQCESYADGWMAALAGCTSMTYQDSIDIRNGLIEVCIGGCNGANMYGSNTSTSTTQNGFISFEQVLQTYLGNNYQDSICNPLLLAFPYKYGHNYNAGSGKLDTCACDVILQANYDYNNAQNLPAGINSPEKYIEKYYGIKVVSIKEYLCKCNAAFAENQSSWQPNAVWGQNAANYLTNNVNITAPGPADISCPKCIDCISFNEKSQQFRTLYPYVNQITDSARYFYLLTTYLNNELNMNLGMQDYIDFTQTCANYQINCQASSCANDFVNVLNELAASNVIPYPSSMIDLCISNIVSNCNFRCFEGWGMRYINSLNIWEAYYNTCGGQYDPCPSSNTLLMRFNEGNCKIKLIAPANYSINWANISSFINFSPVQSCSLTNQFVINAVINRIDTITLYGELIGECFNIAECTGCSDTIPKLCNVGLIEVPQDTTNTCVEYLINAAMLSAELAYIDYINEEKEKFITAFVAKCISAINTEVFNVNFDDFIYHTTLYYYDQAENLTKTVSPLGVATVNSPYTTNPSHSYITSFNYNTLGGVTQQSSPDGGTTNYWYDNVGRLIASQDARQSSLNLFSYTLYDDEGRIKEVGEIYSTSNLSHATAKNPGAWDTWHNAGTKTSITRTFYDEPLSTAINNLFTGGQQNLRLRVATVAYYDTDVANTQFNYASHYTYDVHGNVKQVIQDVPELQHLANDKKEISYDYEIVSGNVKQVNYQSAKQDQFYHQYNYDEDNRLKEVITSRDSIIWDTDATYYYYHHGPLARVEIGHHKVQAADYAYTINGWLKGVNSSTLVASRDIGKDGAADYAINQPLLHAHIGRDAYGFTLGYFEDDYKSIKSFTNNQKFEAITSGSGLASGNQYYNGNISFMSTAILGLTNPYIGTKYSYDRLYRLTGMTAFDNLILANNKWDSNGALSDYATTYQYDANGNITHLTRNGISSVQTAMDDLQYIYSSGTNKLTQVTDNATDNGGYDDIKQGQASNNYTYDATGQLTANLQENITNITWTPYHKVKAITKTSGNDNIEFKYDATGNRIVKIIDHGSGNKTFTYYIYDAQGNIMATYTRELDNTITRTDKLKMSEHSIYGSSRVGVRNSNHLLATWNITNSTLTTGTFEDTIRKLGLKHYELVNHLGNVLSTVSDKKIKNNSNIITDNFTASISPWTNYNGGSATHNTNKMKVSTSATNTGAKRSLSTTAGEIYILSAFIDMGTSSQVKVAVFDNTTQLYSETTNITQTVNFAFKAVSSITDIVITRSDNLAGTKEFYVDDVVIDNNYYEADIKSAHDYYPFGAIMPGRSYNANSYRYAYNGMLKDDEVYNGSGNSYTTYFRQHDTRLGRWFSVDPEFQPWQSPYTSMDNNPIMFTDPLGNSAVGSLLSSIGAYFKKNYTTTTSYANVRTLSSFTVTKVNWTNVLSSTLSVVFNSRTYQNQANYPAPPKIDARKPDYVNQVKETFQWINTNKTKLPLNVPIDKLVDYNSLKENKNFDYIIAQSNFYYKSKSNSNPTVIIQQPKINLVTDLYIINYSNIDIKYERISLNERKIRYINLNGKKPHGIISIIVPSSDPTNESQRNVGIQINFDISDPNQYEMFKTFNRELGGVSIKKHYTGDMKIKK
jgi:RHS repeat-associated protein